MDIHVVFNEELDRVTCATLLAETIKYILFHRFQTPLPFDQFKTEDERDRSTEAELLRKSPKSRPIPPMVKKKRQIIADIEELLLRLMQLFLQVDILDVLLLFGATVVNPKEIYSIRFQNVRTATEADRLKAISLTGKENGLVSRSKFVDKCCRQLARTLFTDPNLNECDELKCTSINCFVLAPRDCNIDWFKPKASFKVPKKGKVYFIEVSESTLDETESKSTAAAMGVGGNVEEHGGNEDNMWFQAPVVLKGYKEAYKATAGSSLWGDS